MDHQRKRRSIWGAFVCVLLCIGCSEDSRSVPIKECSTTADCPQGFVCIQQGQDVQVCVSESQLAADTQDPQTPDFADMSGAVCGLSGNVMVCGDGEQCCGTSCVRTQDDPQNCGACGNVCAQNEACVDGACACGDTPSCQGSGAQLCCPAAADEVACVEAETDPQNCGGCGVVCAESSGEQCLSGLCGCLLKPGLNPSPEDPTLIVVCQEGEVCCPPRPEYPNEVRGCVDLSTPEDCGTCGNTCGEGEQCLNGKCTCGALTAPSPDGLGAACGLDEACCFDFSGQAVCRPQDDCKCGGTLNPTTGRVEGGTTCVGVQMCCHVDLPGLPARAEPTCVDPTKDAENCGGCVLTSEDPLDANNQFRCAPGQLCRRNFDYNLSLPAEEQNAQDIYVGMCVIECGSTGVLCPGGVDEAGVPYTFDRQSCVDSLSSREFCGALPRRDEASTAGQCSVSDPLTFGELRNFKGVPCDAGQTCRAKLQCPNPTPFPGTEADGVTPCDPRNHFYYDVAASSDAEFPAGTLLPSDAVFNPAVDARAYVENQYLRAVCDVTCPDTTVRCVDASLNVICVNPDSNSEFCGAIPNTDCSGDVDAAGAPGPLGGDNNGVNCQALPNVSGASCSAGSCTNLNCDPGFGDCNSDPDDGCETDLLTTDTHCGQCNAPCQAGPNNVATAECDGGLCYVICGLGFANCQNAAACDPSVTTCDPGESVDVLLGITRDGCETIGVCP